MRVSARVVAILAALSSVAAGSKPAAPRAEIAPGYRAVVHGYPAADIEPLGFAVGGPGLVLVPLQGGLFLAGLNGWYYAPHGLPIHAVASSPEGELYVIRAADDADVVFRWKSGVKRAQPQELARLPKGKYQMLVDRGDCVWIWGLTGDGSYRLWLIEPAHAARALSTTRTPITAVAMNGRSGALVGLGKLLVAMERGRVPIKVAELPAPPEGLAVDASGAIYFSTSAGVFRTPSPRRIEVVARGVHGPLALRHGDLFVLAREQRAVVQISRHGAGIADARDAAALLPARRGDKAALPRDARRRYALALERFDAGDERGARALLAAALAADPRLTEAHLYLGRIAAHAGDWQKAAAEYGLYLKRPGAADAAAARRELAEARRMIAATPTERAAERYASLLKRANAARAAGHAELAMALAREAAAADPTGGWDALALTAELFMAGERWSDAQPYWAQAIERAPEVARATLRPRAEACARARVRAELTAAAARAHFAGDERAAAARYLDAWRLEPEREELALGAITSLLLAGDVAGAQRVFAASTVEGGRGAPRLAALAQKVGVLAHADDGRRAEQLYRDAEAAEKAGRIEAALSSIDAALQVRHDDARFQSLLGEIQAAAGNKMLAEQAFAQAAAARGPSADVAVRIATFRRTAGNLGAAEATLRQALRQDAGSPVLARALGDVLAQQRRYGDAEAAYRAAAQVVPGMADVHAQLGNVLVAEGKLAAAERELRQAVTCAPWNGEHHLALASLLVKENKGAEAKQHALLAAHLGNAVSANGVGVSR